MTNRTAFITGASRGIGRACAVAMSEAGARVALASRNTAQLEELAAEIRAQGREAFAVTIDMASAESIQEAFAKTAKEFGPVTILVNNAGITKDGLALRMKKDDWDSVLATNLTGSFLATQQVLQHMMKERWGRIINISSVVGEMGNPGPGQLRRVEGWSHRINQGAGAGDGQPQHYCQRRRAGFHRDRHDAETFAGAEGQPGGSHCA